MSERQYSYFELVSINLRSNEPLQTTSNICIYLTALVSLRYKRRMADHNMWINCGRYWCDNLSSRHAFVRRNGHNVHRSH